MTSTAVPARFDEAPRAASHGGFIHTCNGDVRSGLPFGRKNPDECARCWELVNGAAPRADHVARRRNRAAEAAELSAAIRAHDCTVSAARPSVRRLIGEEVSSCALVVASPR